MVKAKLLYNPYLQEIQVEFNGQKPRINSLVEKYQNQPLYSWLNKVPKIFYDEMNGYDFQLDFVGTKLDYEELKQTFKDAKVTEDMVSIIHKNELDSRTQKISEIDKLLSWLDNNRNRKFDYDHFKDNNQELFESPYQLITINGSNMNNTIFEDLDVLVENILDINLLKEYNLEHVPLLFCVDETSISSLQNNLKQLLPRKDVFLNQIFFMILPPLNESMTVRFIRDLGITNPQIVSTIEDYPIRKYLEIYPVTDYLNNVITLFRNHINDMTSFINEEIKANEIQNKEIYERINLIDSRIEHIKKAINDFENRDTIVMSDNIKNELSRTINSIQNWKYFKIKTTKEQEAQQLSSELDDFVHTALDNYIRKANDIITKQKNDIYEQYLQIYQQSEIDNYYNVIETNEMLGAYSLVSIKQDLLDLKEEDYVLPKEDLMNRFFRQSDESKEKVLEITFYFSKWREFAIEKITKVLNQIIDDSDVIVKEYANKLSDNYLVKLKELLLQQEQLKDNEQEKLSEEEKKLQVDNEWIEEFNDQLNHIERR